MLADLLKILELAAKVKAPGFNFDLQKTTSKHILHGPLPAPWQPGAFNLELRIAC